MQIVGKRRELESASDRIRSKRAIVGTRFVIAVRKPIASIAESVIAIAQSLHSISDFVIEGVRNSV